MVPVVSLVGLGLFERGFPVVKALVALLLFGTQEYDSLMFGTHHT
jgi:hypothetical protein